MKKIIRLTESDLTRIVKRTINEMFGLSKKEKDQKKLIQDIKKAKQEIDSLDISSVFRETKDNFDNEKYQKLINIIVRNLKDKLPTFLELFPQVLDDMKSRGTNAMEVRFDYKGETLKGITLSTLAPFLIRSHGDRIGTSSKELMKRKLDNLNKD